jgi:hypothetical protein
MVQQLACIQVNAAWKVALRHAPFDADQGGAKAADGPLKMSNGCAAERQGIELCTETF